MDVSNEAMAQMSAIMIALVPILYLIGYKIIQLLTTNWAQGFVGYRWFLSSNYRRDDLITHDTSLGPAYARIVDYTRTNVILDYTQEPSDDNKNPLVIKKYIPMTDIRAVAIGWAKVAGDLPLAIEKEVDYRD